MNTSGALFGLLLFLQIMLVLGVMLGGIYALACLRRMAAALETLAENSLHNLAASQSAAQNFSVSSPMASSLAPHQSVSNPPSISVAPSPVSSHDTNSD